jgi:hypothetical protein
MIALYVVSIYDVDHRVRGHITDSEISIHEVDINPVISGRDGAPKAIATIQR